MLEKESKRINEIKRTVDGRLKNAPDGTLRITTTKNQYQYIHCKQEQYKQEQYKQEQYKQEQCGQVQCTETSNNQKFKLSYIKKENLSLAKQLAQKSYDQKIKKLVDRREKQLERLTKEYSDDEIVAIYNNLNHKRKELVIPVEPTYEQLLAQWKSVPYVGRDFKDVKTEIYTKKGERVRSKSEKILADMFYDMGVEYKYECPLHLKGYGIVYPDFTFLSRKTYEEIYWEHDGRMDDPEYAEKAIRKIDHYTRNEIIPGQRLIITYESANYALNTYVAEKFIKEYLL
ncbi:hypothetical protein [Butyrivibrio sp. FCS014]|uniref:hypothetical protein n=1 Tax=Butyrivibrio sp. FCS014 TaxID=1408304 RepID=UPI0012DCC9C6|nr:hypothetical protein [Butyrivibrio sp. FCS014]